MVDKDSSETGSVIVRAVGFLRECREELAKVVKPTRQEAMQAAGVTLVIIVLVSLILAAFDLVFGTVMQVLLS